MDDVHFFFSYPSCPFLHSEILLLFFSSQTTTNRADVVGVEREIWVSDERADERKKEEKSRRSPSSLIGSSPPGRKTVCTNTYTYTYTHSICTKTHKSSVQQPSSNVFLSLIRLPSFPSKFRRTYINLFSLYIDPLTPERRIVYFVGNVRLFLSLSLLFFFSLFLLIERRRRTGKLHILVHILMLNCYWPHTHKYTRRQTQWIRQSFLR